jgi:hypothetical protein
MVAVFFCPRFAHRNPPWVFACFHLFGRFSAPFCRFSALFCDFFLQVTRKLANVHIFCFLHNISRFLPYFEL